MPVATEAPEVVLESGLDFGQYEAVVELRKELNRPFEPADVLTGEYREELAELAEEYTRTYRGNFGFVQDVAIDLRKKGYLSPGQAKGVLNCVVAEYNRLPKADAEPLKVENSWTLPDGRYTLVRENGTHRTLRIKRCNWERYQKPEGTRIVSFLSGPDNTSDYTGVGFVLPNGEVILWSRFREDSLLAKDIRMFLSMTRDDAVRATENNVTIMGMTTCAICGRDLTNPASISRGIGPECAKKF